MDSDLLKQIRVIINAWDPVKLMDGAPEDEYDDLVMPAYSALMNGKSASDIKRLIEKLLLDRYELSVSPDSEPGFQDDLEKTAQRIADLRGAPGRSARADMLIKPEDNPQSETSKLQRISKILNMTIIPRRWIRIANIVLWSATLILFLLIFFRLRGGQTYADIMGAPDQSNQLTNSLSIRLHIYKDIGGDFKLGQRLHIKRIGNSSPTNCKIVLNTEYVSSFDGLASDVYHRHEQKRWEDENEFTLQFDHDFTNVGFFKNAADKALPRQQQIRNIRITCNEGTGEWAFPDIVSKFVAQ